MGEEYEARVRAHRAQREERLRDPRGWLALVGLSWLAPGENRVGADPDADVVLRGTDAPEEAGRIVQEAAHEDANIIFGAVIDEALADEVRITVIATGFTERKEAREPAAGKVVEIPKGPRVQPGRTDWRRRMADLRAEADGPADDDLDVPAFLRRQAD